MEMKHGIRYTLRLIAALLAVSMAFFVCAGALDPGAAAQAAPAAEAEEGGRTLSLCLKDNWHVYLDPGNVGESKEWYTGFLGGGKTVSLPYDTTHDGWISTIWFSNLFEADLELKDGERAVIDFEGTQYYAKVWLNGNYIGDHEGGVEKFSFDVTDYVRLGEENLLALRLYTPRGEDDYEGGHDGELAYGLFGGNQRIQTPVYLRAVPEVYVSDTYADTNYEDGTIDMYLTVQNAAYSSRRVDVTTELRENEASLPFATAEKEFRVEPGESVLTYTMKVEDFKAWSPDEPNLYDMSIVLRNESTGICDYSNVAVGFKDLRVDDEGFFVLNGERIFIKSCHIGNYVIGSIDVGADLERHLHQLDYYKASGFNTVRVLSGIMLPEAVDYCDRIGLMVFEEPYMSWKQTDFERTTDLFHDSAAQIVRRDRSHVSFSILCTLNETYGTEETGSAVRYAAALSTPPVVRELDDDVLMLLSSGRWDNDRSVGSACNPGSTTWDGYMGDEGEESEEGLNSAFLLNFKGMGDLHYYPQMPYNALVRDAFHSMGDVRASFLSETGAGSQPNIISDYYTQLQEKSYAINSSNNPRIKTQLELLSQLFRSYKLDQVYAAQEDFITETQVLAAQQRSLLVDYIRSTPKISGYSMTQGSDIAYRGEGILEGMMTHKATMFDTVTDCWNDLRWCINVDKYNMYSDEDLHLMVDLSNVNVLEKDTEYNVYLTITDADGKIMWSKNSTVSDNGTYVIPVTDEQIPLADFPGGEYKISAVIAGAQAGSSTKSFWVADKSELPKASGTIYYYGLSNEAVELLKAQGAVPVEFSGQSIPAGSTILLGHVTSNSILDAAYAAAETNGCHVAGISSESFGGSLYSLPNIPFAEGVALGSTQNWLYHSDSIVHDTAVNEGLEVNGALSPLYYEDIYDATYYAITVAPDEPHCVQLLLGDDATANDYTLLYGVKCGTYNYGSGRITLNTFDLNDNVGTPVADRMILNLANYAGDR